MGRVRAIRQLVLHHLINMSRRGRTYDASTRYIRVQALLARADAKVKELKQSFQSFKAETEKLEVTLSVDFCLSISVS